MKIGRGQIVGAIKSMLLRRRGLEIGSNLTVYGMPIVQLYQGSKISIGDNVVLTSDSRYTALGVKHPVIVRTLSEHAHISIGNFVGLSGTAICAFSSVTIGDECLIGADVTIVDTDFHPIEPIGRRFAPIRSAYSSPVVIGRNVFLGANSVVLKGVRIGQNSVIGCASVVTQDIPENCIAAGNPCRVIRRL